MLKTISRVLCGLVVAATLAACGASETVPITGRKHRLLVSDSEILGLSTQEYTKYMQTAKPSTNKTNTAMVQRVGQKLATAVETYLRGHGYAAEVQNFKWEFNLVQDKQVNAFCMPGGKIVVYEGILPVTQDENGLAIVLGHEIAHAVAKHSAEQMSKQQRAKMGSQVIGSLATSGVMGPNTASTVGSLYGLGSNLAQLKYSRSNESEADYMGLVFAAMAGYDPNGAIAFWQRMASLSGGSSQPSFLSTHPSDAKRISDLQARMPEAMKYYKK